MISYSQTPIQEIESPFLTEAGVRLLVKREDLNHPGVSGNKWWKLKYNLEQASKEGQDTLLTFGGAYSNHLYAVAAAASALGMKSIGIVRGEETLPLNSTLRFVKTRGMEIHYVSRQAYREKQNANFLHELQEKFGRFYMLPEGGTNALAVKGCLEFSMQLVEETEFDTLCLPVGTGGTMAGMVAGLKQHQQAIGISVLKHGEFLNEEVKRWLTADASNWRIETGFDFGGYAKSNRELLDFIRMTQEQHNLPLDQVYTAKTLFGIYELIRAGKIRRSSVVMMLHTGGLQGALAE